MYQIKLEEELAQAIKRLEESAKEPYNDFEIVEDETNMLGEVRKLTSKICSYSSADQNA